MMKKSFFTRIKSKLNRDYGGRYMGLVLQEILTEKPQLSRHLWPNEIGAAARRTAIFELEKKFGQGNRIADLAMVDPGGNILALLEIKYEDHKSPHNAAQLDDYIKYSKVNNVQFTYLTKHMPPPEDLQRLEMHRHLSYRAFSQAVEGDSDRGPIGELFCTFMRESGIMYQADLDRDSLLLLIAKSCHFRNQTGFGKLTSRKRISEDVPNTLQGLVGNVNVLADRLYDAYQQKIFSVRPYTHFSMQPILKMSSLEQAISKIKYEDEDEDEMPLESKAVFAGNLFVYFEGSIPASNRDKDYLYLEGGYSFRVDPGKKTDALKQWIYAAIHGKQVSNIEETTEIDLFKESTSAESSAEEDRIYKKLSQVVIAVCKQCLTGESSDRLSDQQRKILKLIAGE